MKVFKRLKLISYLRKIPGPLWTVLFLDSVAELLLLYAARVTDSLKFIMLFGGSFGLGVISWVVWQSLNVKWHQ
jgi:hypothetical protein